MRTPEDKQKQALARIEEALKKKDFAERFLEQAKQEIQEAMRMLEEDE